MGLVISGFIDRISSFSKNKESKMLILGLDGAGKTSLLYKLALGEYVCTVPTIGFNVEKIKYKSLDMTIWDIAGQKHFRNLWRHYYNGANAIIFVIDSADKERIELVKEELYGLLDHPELSEAKILIFANKQDIAEISVSELSNRLELHTLKRPWYIQGCTCVTGEGVNEGFDWLGKELAK